MRYELKSVPIWPLAKVSFFVHLAVGFVIGIFYALAVLPFFALLSNIPELQAEGIDMGAAPMGFLMIFMPFFTAITGAFFGTLFSIILALVYNLLAKMVGGLELNLQSQEERPPETAAATRSVAPEWQPPPPPESRPAAPPPPPPVGDKPRPESPEPPDKIDRVDPGPEDNTGRPDLT